MKFGDFRKAARMQIVFMPVRVLEMHTMPGRMAVLLSRWTAIILKEFTMKFACSKTVFVMELLTR